MLGSNSESVGSEDEPKSLHPCFITSMSWVMCADEVGVNVKFVVGDEAKVVVLSSIEVEDDVVTTYDLWVTANATFLLAVGCRIIK